jgi:adenosylcobyric acid synthase
VPAVDTDVAALKDRQLEVLGDAVANHLDTAALERLITHGAPPGLPRLSPTLIASEVLT